MNSLLLQTARRASSRTFLPAFQSLSLSTSTISPSSSSSFSSRTISTRTLPTRAEEEGHNDFAPKMKKVDPNQKVQDLISGHVRDNKIMLYMKGTPSQPQCGFSGKVVQILNNHEVDFSSVNVLEYPSIREGVKVYSGWPTVPQLYVNGEFVGGADIVGEMDTEGELKGVLDSAKE